MNAFYGVIIGASLNVLWVIAVNLSLQGLKKGKLLVWLHNPRALRALTPVYYMLLIGTLGVLLTVPWLFVGKPEGMICTTPVLLNTCLITFSRPYSEVRTTAEGRALCVIIYSALSIALIPVALLIAHYFLE